MLTKTAQKRINKALQLATNQRKVKQTSTLNKGLKAQIVRG